MTRHRIALLVMSAALLPAVVACSGRSAQLNPPGGDSQDNAASKVQPPPKASDKLTGRVGLIVATNSPSFPKIIKSAADPGVVVLFVQPDGPADKAGVERGDVVTKVNGEASTNAERAVVQLRARPKERRQVEVLRAGGAKKAITITTEEPPKNVDLRALYGPRIAQSPDDPVLYFLRAQTEAEYDELFADVQKAVELEPSFVEAISLRAELQWNRAGNKQANLTPEQVEELRDKAMEDWNLALKLDAENTRALGSRSQALSQQKNASSARRDAQRAMRFDPDFPGAHYALAVANYELGRYDQAAEPARTAIDLNPFDVRYYRALAAVFMKLDRPDAARRTVAAIIDLVDVKEAREDLLRIVEPSARRTPRP